MVGPNGGVAQQLATSAEGVPFRFTNGLDIDSTTGVVYFTDSSIFFQRRDLTFTLSLPYSSYSLPHFLYYLLLRITSNRSGLLLEYDSQIKNVSVMYRDLAFSNDVTLNADNSYLLVAESDIIQRNKNGEFWVGLISGRSGRIQNDAYTKLPDPVGVKLDQEGKILTQSDGNGGITFNSISEIYELTGTLYIGSVTKPYLGILDA
ncbi:Strictosidine synthase [Theobroma cacao]|nr:Strictosidine synthase [Theobroma cacao]